MFSEISLPVPSQQMTRFLAEGGGQFRARCPSDAPRRDATGASIAENGENGIYTIASAEDP